MSKIPLFSKSPSPRKQSASPAPALDQHSYDVECADGRSKTTVSANYGSAAETGPCDELAALSLEDGSFFSCELLGAGSVRIVASGGTVSFKSSSSSAALRVSAIHHRLSSAPASLASVGAASATSTQDFKLASPTIQISQRASAPCKCQVPHHIFIKGVDGKTLTYDVLPCTTIDALKLLILERTGIPPDRQRLIFAGKQLENGRTLGYYGVTLECTIHLVLRLCGGKPVIYLFPPSSLARAQVSLALSPEWTFSALYPVVDINKDDVVVEGVEQQVKQRVEWTVAAEPDGSLVELSSGLELSYLFWEATSTGIITSSSLSSSSSSQQVDLEPSFHPSSPSLDHSNGVVLAFSPFLAHLDAALSSLSLHTSARNDFITFWLPHFVRIRDAGKEVLFRFLPQAEYARAAELDVEPKPDVVTRVFLLFKGVEPGSSSSSSSSGRSAAEVDWVREVGVDEAKARDESLFRVLEWGGMECV